MSRNRSLEEMIADVRTRTNLENSTFVTDAEITEYLNQELAELWGHLTQGAGQPPFRSVSTVAVTPGTTLYPLDATFWQLQGVEAVIDGITTALRPFMPFERAGMVNASSLTARYPWHDTLKYRIQGDNIEFLPDVGAFTANVWFTPCQPRLTTGSDTFDGFNGFEVAAIYGACATVQAKEETDPSFYLGQRERIYGHISGLIAQRDASMPERVQDVMSSGDVFFGQGWTP